MNENDLMIGEALYNVVNYRWQFEGNYHIGESIEEAKEHNRSNQIQLLSYDDAIEALGRGLLFASQSRWPELDKESRVGAIATQMFVLAHGYCSFTSGKSAFDVFMDLFKFTYERA